MTKRYMPEGFHTVTPNIISDRAEGVIAFLTKAFGAEERLRLTMPDGALVHCELQIGDSRINVGQAMEGWPEHALVAQIFVPDSDAGFAQAIAAGASELMPVSDMFFGSREGRVTDPFGNTWTIATLKEELSQAEMQRRINAQAG